MPATASSARRALAEVFGFESFRPHQEGIVERLLAGEDAFVVMPTGGGKSLCYQLPALLREGVGIVVSPLIALMQDQVDALQQQGVRAAALHSGIDGDTYRETLSALHSGTLDLLYVAPERAVRPRFMERLEEVDRALFAIDEAHCISQWGHDFRPEYHQLDELRHRFPQTPCIAVTATADAPTRRDVQERLGFTEDDTFVTGFDRPNITYRVVPKQGSGRKQLRAFLEAEHEGDAGIVYCLSRREVEETAEWLSAQGREALPYHAGLSSEMRDKHQRRFLREEGLVVVATVAFGMGIDKPNVRFVAHLHVPKSLEAYYQETGRAGRDGLPANAWMAYGLSDVVTIRRLMMSDEPSSDHDWTQRHKLDALVGYCETTACRRRVLLGYFGETGAERCEACDNCLDPVDTWDATVPVQKLLSCIARTDQRFGSGHVIDVLRGGDTKKVRKYGHQHLSTYGIGDELSARQWRSVIRQCVALGLIRVDVAGYGALKLDEACAPVLSGDERVELRDELRRRKTKKTTGKDELQLPETDEAHRLFETLRTHRLELAREQEVPPYVIFHDSTLVAMVLRQPQDIDAFGELPGVGAVKQKRYGPSFLEVLQQAA